MRIELFKIIYIIIGSTKEETVVHMTLLSAQLPLCLPGLQSGSPATIKNKWPIKFLGITGVTRLKDVEIFSIGSDIRDITNASAYSQMIGFTRDEIKKYCYERDHVK